MPQKHRLGLVSEIPLGKGKEFVVAGKIIAAYNIDGVIHALDGICPHSGGPLAKGFVRGNVVTCPWHGWQFNVCTGQNCLNSTLNHTAYSVILEGDEVYIELPDS